MNDLIKNLAIVGTLATALGTAGTARAVTIDFNSLDDPADEDGFFALPGSNYTEKGYNLNAGNSFFGSLINSQASTYNGTASLFNNGLNSNTTLTENNGKLFKLNSVDLDWLNGDGDSNNDGIVDTQLVPVTFTGLKFNNSTVSRTFHLDLQQGLQTFSFGGRFNKLQSVSWQQQPDFHQFDNINVEEVPEPLTILGSLAALGMGMTLKREYSRRQASTLSK